MKFEDIKDETVIEDLISFVVEKEKKDILDWIVSESLSIKYMKMFFAHLEANYHATIDILSSQQDQMSDEVIKKAYEIMESAGAEMRRVIGETNRNEKILKKMTFKEARKIRSEKFIENQMKKVSGVEINQLTQALKRSKAKGTVDGVDDVVSEVFEKFMKGKKPTLH